jgi:hypothetical protein
MAQSETEQVFLEQISGGVDDYYTARLSIDKAELNGGISKGFATQARRVIKSTKALEATTDDNKFGDIIQLVNDANAKYGRKYNVEQYLSEVSSIRGEVMKAQASGQISQDHANKLYNSIATMTSKTTSEATQRLPSRGDYTVAIDTFEKTINPIYNGTALRRYFDLSNGKDLSNEGQKDLALKVADEISNEKRAEVQDAVKRAIIKKNSSPIQKTVDTQTLAPLSNDDVLSRLGATIEDVTYTMEQTGLSEEQVFEKLRGKL